MEFSVAESFLLGWALVSTCIAGYYQNKYNKSRRAGFIMCLILAGVATNRVKISNRDGKYVFSDGDNEVSVKEVEVE